MTQNREGAPKRRGPGKPFQAGNRANPGGRPKKLLEVTALAQQATETAMKALTTIARDTNAPHAARVSAAVALLDRGWGRPTQRQEIELRADLPAALEAMRGAAVDA